MSIFDQFSKVTKDFGNKAQEMTKDIKGKLEEQQAISRLNAQVNEAKNQMKNTYMAIGERYYELHKDDVENDMANQFQIIADAMEKIAKCEQQIRDIKNENTCPSCGATISKDVLSALLGAFDETVLPYFVDIVVYGHIKNLALKEHIDRIGTCIYSVL